MANKDEDTDDAFAILGRAVLGLVALVVLTIWQGFTIAALWNWFVAPFGVATIGTAHGVGLGALISMARAVKSGKKDERTVFEMCIDLIVYATMALSMGAIAHAFM